MGTKIRSSNQLYVDALLDVNSQKIGNLAAGTAAGHAVEYAQMNTAINNAIAGAGNAIHEPVADLAAAKAIAIADTTVNGIVTVGGRTDKMIMLIETLGLYRFDAESTATSNDGTVIRPTDVSTDAAAGRWLKISSTLTSHALLDEILGNGAYHLSEAERNKLNGIEAAADVTDAGNVGTAIHGSTGKTTPVDADTIAMIDSESSNILTKITFANLKMFIWAAISGDITISALGVAVIGALKVATGMVQANAITNAKLAQVATATFKGRTTAGTGDPEDLTVAQAKSLLGLTEQAGQTRTYNAVPTGTIDGTNPTFNIAALVISGSMVVYKNGLRQNPGAGNDYTVNTAANPAVITFLTGNIPLGGTVPDVILVDYSA
jgi:hypothetical protein